MVDVLDLIYGTAAICAAIWATIERLDKHRLKHRLDAAADRAWDRAIAYNLSVDRNISLRDELARRPVRKGDDGRFQSAKEHHLG